jgi:hypothetical protein
MSTVFDPIEERGLLDSDTGYEWSLARTFEEVESKKALTHVANANLVKAIRCILVGYDEPAGRLARRAQEWLTIAVQKDEQTHRFPIAYKAQRHFDLALCAWLLRGECDEDNLRLFVEIKNQHYALQGDLDKVDVSFGAVNFLDAGDDRATLDLLLQAGIGPPSSFSAIRTEGQMAYVICRKRLGEAYQDEDVDSALAAFLKRGVNAWLIDGHYMRAALWMKAAHWGQGGPLTPQETVRKAYDYLAGVARPEPVTRRI